MSRAVARSYVDKVKTGVGPREALPVLLHIGILQAPQRAIVGPHIKASTKYRLSDHYRGRLRPETVLLPPKLAEKLGNAKARREKGLDSHYVFRGPLRSDLARLSLSDAGHAEADRLLNVAPDMRCAVELFLRGLRGKGDVRVTSRGQIWSFVNSCPRGLKRHLLLDGMPTVSCDISHAHYCFLPRLLADRIAFFRRREPEVDVPPYEAEKARLTTFLSEGDYYRKWCREPSDDQEREEKKMLLTMLLNWPTAKAEGNALYRYVKGTFPLVFAVVEDLKRKDHRNLAKQLQPFTAWVIRDSLLELQRIGVSAIPDVDALIYPTRAEISMQDYR